MVPPGHTLLLLSSLLMCFFTFVLLTYYTPGHGGFGQQADSAPQKPGWAGRSSRGRVGGGPACVRPARSVFLKALLHPYKKMEV